MGRPGHISPCCGPNMCPICKKAMSMPMETVQASVHVERAIHQTRDRAVAAKLWRAKVLIDEVINDHRHMLSFTHEGETTRT